MYNFTQHDCSIEQMKEGVIEVPNKQFVRDCLTIEDLPTENDLIERANKLAEYAASLNADSVMIGGAMYLMPYLIDALQKKGIESYYAFSKRESVDQVLEDGSVVKKAIFKHLGFVKGTLPEK